MKKTQNQNQTPTQNNEILINNTNTNTNDNQPIVKTSENEIDKEKSMLNEKLKELEVKETLDKMPKDKQQSPQGKKRISSSGNVQSKLTES